MDAIIGALALGEYGHRRATVGVDLVIRGYAERVPGTGKLLDTENTTFTSTC